MISCYSVSGNHLQSCLYLNIICKEPGYSGVLLNSCYSTVATVCVWDHNLSHEKKCPVDVDRPVTSWCRKSSFKQMLFISASICVRNIMFWPFTIILKNIYFFRNGTSQYCLKSPTSDQDRISPYNINTIATR